jgi:hypothetical protein
MMRFQVPPRAESLNHTRIPHVNSLPSKLIDGKYFSYIMSKSHKSILEKNLLDIAVLDKNLFEKSAITYENLGYLDSIISDMCDIPTYGKENVRVFMIEIHDQLADVQNAISDLYRECTGKDLKEIFATPKL